MHDFEPIVRNSHLLTLFGNFWPRRYDARYPTRAVYYQTCPEARVLVHEQRPATEPRGEVILVHGLEGSSDGGYMRSMARAAVEAGFVAHRANIRGCGGTESTCRTLYHSGLTTDLLFLLDELRGQGRAPVYVVGFSLGGNQTLKLAGELGERAPGLVDAVCAVSTPIDLAACVRALGEPPNFLYEWRFVARMKERMHLRHGLMPDVFAVDGLEDIETVYDFDDRITAPFFGFGTADNYYETQSAIRFLDQIRVPTLLIAAQDDPLVPFDVYSHPSIRANPYLELRPEAHGGHLGFVSRRKPRFWLDHELVAWLAERADRYALQHGGYRGGKTDAA